MLVPVGVLQNSSDVFAILDPDSGGAATFSVRLSPNGLEPVTFRGASTYLLADTHNALRNMTVTQFKTYVDQVAAQRGRTPVGSVTAFKNALLMGEIGQDFWAFCTANGLRPVASPAL
jgi:hypothetical protein